MSKIEARVIMEIMGRPPEHITESLNTLVLRMGTEEGIKIINKKYHEPAPVPEARDLFTAFVELDVELKDVDSLLMIAYIYSPSNIEVISPENIKINNDAINDFLSNLLARVHHYGALLKRSNTEKDILLAQIQYLRKKLGDKVDKTLQQMAAEFNKITKREKPVKEAKKSTKKKKSKK